MPKDSLAYFFISFPLQRRTLSITLSGKFCVIKSKHGRQNQSLLPCSHEQDGDSALTRLSESEGAVYVAADMQIVFTSTDFAAEHLLSTKWAWAIKETLEIRRCLRCVPETQGGEKIRGTASHSDLWGSWNSSHAQGTGAVRQGWADPHCEERGICCGGGESVDVVRNTNRMIFQICLQGKTKAHRSAVTYLTTNDCKSTLAFRQERREGGAGEQATRVAQREVPTAAGRHHIWGRISSFSFK